MPGLPGESQILSGSADVMENLHSSCTGAHSSIRGELTAKRERLAVFNCPSKRQSALCPGLCGGFFHKWCWVTQVQVYARRPPPLIRCGEMKVWELLLFVPGTCAGAATWAEGRLGDAVAQVSSLVGNRNDKWLPLGTPPAFLQDRLSLAAGGLHTDRVGTRLSGHRPPLRSPHVSAPSPHSSPAPDEAPCPTANLKVSKC